MPEAPKFICLAITTFFELQICIFRCLINSSAWLFQRYFLLDKLLIFSPSNPTLSVSTKFYNGTEDLILCKSTLQVTCHLHLVSLILSRSSLSNIWKTFFFFSPKINQGNSLLLFHTEVLSLCDYPSLLQYLYWDCTVIATVRKSSWSGNYDDQLVTAVDLLHLKKVPNGHWS